MNFEITNFRKYNCSTGSQGKNCRIVELFLTVDTKRKMQNGVNIDVSVDRGVDILRNDVDAILAQIINSNFIKNARHSALPPGQYPRPIASMRNSL